MSKQANKWLLITAVFFLIAGLTLGIVEKPTGNTSKFAARIESHLHEMEREVDVLISEGTTLGNLTNKTLLSVDVKKMALFKKPYTITIYKEDSLVFWNNIAIGCDMQTTDCFHKYGDNKILNLHNGFFYVKDDSIPNLGRVVSFLPVKYRYKIETNYLKDIFAVDKYRDDSWYYGIPPDEIKIVEKGNGKPIYNVKGEEVFGVLAVAPVKMPWVSYALFVLYLFAFVFAVLWFTQYSRFISKTQKPWKGVVLLGTGLLIGRLLMLYFNVSDSFADVLVFEERYPSNYFAYTIGDMLINTILCVWVSVFYFKEFKITNLDKFNFSRVLSASVFLYGLIVLGVLAVTYVFKGLVLDTNIPFDFDKIGDLEWTSFLSIIGIILLMLMLFLFSYRSSLIIRELGLNLKNRLFGLVISIALVFTLMHVISYGYGYLITYFAPLLSGTVEVFTLVVGDVSILDSTTLVLLLLFSIIYIISFDLYVETDSSNTLWIIIWLGMYSAFSSAFLYRYNEMKELAKRIQYAEFLTNDRDEEMEEELQLLKNEISTDDKLEAYLSKDLDYDKVEDLLLRNHSIDLRFIRYKHHLHLFVEDSFANLMPIGLSEVSLVRSYDKIDITLESNLRFVRGNDGLGTYLLKLKYPRKQSRGDVILLLEFSREVGENTKISTELFMNDAYRDIEGLSAYEYAIYRNNELVYQEGGEYEFYMDDIENLPMAGKYRFEIKNGESHLIYHAHDGNLALMNIELPNILTKVRSLMSHLFTMMILVLGILMIINAIIEIFTFEKQPLFTPSPSLKNKIQVSVIAIIIISFFVIGIATIFFFEGKNDEYHEGRLGRKAKSIMGDTAREIKKDSIDAYSLYKFKEIVEPVSEIHSMDVNIYDLEGRLIESSGDDIFSKGLISPLMNAVALYELGVQGKDKVIMGKENSEEIGELIYEAQYELLKDNLGNVIAYIGMPYYSQKSILQNDTSEFIGNLLNVYVILLAFAGFIAIFVANSITKPLSQIGDKLKELKIGKKNEPLEWSSRDELGDLITEYNKMIKKLDDSTMLLAQSERENAWREMAKQVAHEIKNPLTPMKLSIQYLQHAYHSNPANMESMLKRVCNTLVEQIDNLSHIATEFSNFAKMPRAENERFELKQLVQSVYDLFSEQREMEMTISLPVKKLMVFADKNQLMRVFNNLIKNAMQAIPEDKEGSIAVVLREIDGDLVQLEVEDNGSGISEDMKEYIFVPHITTKSSGTGLGLAISKSIIEALDGNIYFESIEGRGTSFFVELPISKENTHYEG